MGERHGGGTQGGTGCRCRATNGSGECSRKGFSINVLASGEVCMPQLASICAAQWELCDTRFWQRCDDGWTLDGTTRGGWFKSHANNVCARARVCPLQNGRAGSTRDHEDCLQDDTIFIGSAPGTSLRARWPTQVADSVATNAAYGRRELNSLRTQSCRWRFGICV